MPPHARHHADPGQVLAHHLQHVDLGRPDDAEADERAVAGDDIERGLNARSTSRPIRSTDRIRCRRSRAPACAGDRASIAEKHVAPSAAAQFETRLVAAPGHTSRPARRPPPAAPAGAGTRAALGRRSPPIVAGAGLTRSSVCTAVASGSRNAALSSVTSSGSGSSDAAGHDDELGQHTGARETDVMPVLTQVVAAAQAVIAVAAAGHRLDADARPRRRPAGARPERDDLARRLRGRRSAATAPDGCVRDTRRRRASRSVPHRPDWPMRTSASPGPGTGASVLENLEMADAGRGLDRARAWRNSYQPRISIRASVQFRMMLM